MRAQVEQIQPKKFEFEKRAQQLTKNKGLGYFVLIMSVLGSSSIGVVSNFVTAEGAYLKNAWRFLALTFISVFLIPFYFMYDKYYLKYERYRTYISELNEKGVMLDKKLKAKDQFARQSLFPQGRPTMRLTTIQVVQKSWAEIKVEDIFGDRTFKKHLYFLTFLSSMAGALWINTIVWGSKHSIQSHVYAFTNLHGVFALGMIILLGQNVVDKRQKMVTCLMLLLGVLLSLIDPWSHRYDMLNSHGNYHLKKGAFMVDFVLILSNVLAAIYFTMNKFLMKNRIIKHIFVTNICMMFFFVVMAVLYDNAQFDLHPKHGLFGWLAAENAFTCIFFFGFICTFWGVIGYLLCINFFPPIIVMNAILAEPIIAQILGFICRIDAFPSPFTIVGIGLITYSTYMNNMQTAGINQQQNQKQPTGTNLEHVGHIPEQDDQMEDEQDEAKLENHIKLLEEKLNLMKVEAQGYQGKEQINQNYISTQRTQDVETTNDRKSFSRILSGSLYK